jgi:hypothetical protein
MRQWSTKAISAGSHVVSDGQWSVAVVKERGSEHERLVSTEPRLAAKRPELQRVNQVISNMKTAISGTYHAFKFRKYAPRYLAEYQYRFNRRFDLVAILPRLIVACVCGAWMTEKALRAVTMV